MTARRATHAFNAVVLIIGAVALVILIGHVGIDGIRHVLGGIGWWFAVVALIDVAAMGCDAFAIHGFLRAQVPGVRYLPVFAAQASGLAINRLTPGSTLGEPAKVTMLVHHVPRDAAVSAIVMYNLATWFSGIAVIAVGVPLTLLLVDLPPQLELPVWLGTGVLIAVAVVLAILVRRGAIATLIAAATSLRLISRERAARWRTKIVEIDRQVRTLRGLRRGVLGAVGSRVLNSVGTLAILHAAELPITPALVVAMLSVGILVTWMSNIIPLGLGLADTGNYALYGALGVGARAGLDFTLVNRARTLVIAAIGLVIMAIAHLVNARAAPHS